MPSIIGHETDLSLNTIIEQTKKYNLGLPIPLPKMLDGLQILAHGFIKEKEALPSTYINYFSQNVLKENVISEVFLWERPQGGKIFNVGSVAACWPIHTDDAYANLILNVLHYFNVNIITNIAENP